MGGVKKMPTEEDYKRIKGIADAGFSRGMSIPDAIKSLKNNRVLQYGRSADPAWQAEHGKAAAESKPRGGSLTGIWGSIQQELSNLRNTPFAQRIGYEAGIGAKIAGKVAIGAAKALTSDYSVEDPYRSAGPRPEKGRYRQMAGLPTETIASDGPYAPQTQPNPKPGPSETTMAEPGKKDDVFKPSKKSGPSTSAAPLQPARQPADPRQRYLDMAGFNPDDPTARAALMAKVPENERPIEIIRGNTMTFWDPKTQKEYSTPQEAIIGMPVDKSETQYTELEKERIKGAASVEGDKIRAQAIRDAAKISADAAIKKGASGSANEKWTFHETAEGVPMMLEEKSGKPLPIILDEPSKVAAILHSINMTPEDIAFGASVIERMPKDLRNEAFKLLDPERKKLYYDVLEKRHKK